MGLLGQRIGRTGSKQPALPGQPDPNDPYGGITVPNPYATQKPFVLPPSQPNPATTLPLGPNSTVFPTQPADAKPPQPTWQAPWTGTPDTGGYAVPQYTTTGNPAGLSGWDTAKWADPQHQTPKYVVGRILSAYNLGDATQYQQAISDIQRAYPGTTYGGGDTVNIPGIGDVDIVRDFGPGGANGPSWDPIADRVATPAAAPAALASLATPAADTGAGAASSSATSSVDPFAAMGGGVQLPGGGWVPKDHPLAQTVQAAAAAAPAAASTPAAAGAAPAQADLNAASRTALLQMLQAPEPTTADLTQSPAAKAYRITSQRGREADDAQAAEAAAQNGTLGSGGFDVARAARGQQESESDAQFVGQLAVTQMQQRADNLKFAIQAATQSGQFDQAQSLQRELANLQAALTREQMASSAATADKSLALQGQGLAQQGQIANNQLGFNYAQLQALLNSQALQALLAQ